MELLQDLLPSSLAARDVNLSTAKDQEVWSFARLRGLVVATKDADFRQRSMLFGPPPKIIWIAIGNCSTQTIANVFRERYPEIISFESDSESALLILR